MSLFGTNTPYAEALYETYRQDPKAVPVEWRSYFAALDASPTATTIAAKPVGQGQEDVSVEHLFRKQVAVLQLINAYRFRGHQHAHLDPLGLCELAFVPELDPHFHGLDDADLDRFFNTGSLCGVEGASLREILAIVQDTYCRSVGVEYMHINETAQKRWIQQRLEPIRAIPNFSAERKREILRWLVAANSLEEYLHTKYVGQKRFSLEGGESLIPMLDELIQHAGEVQVQEIVLGMAHRGRLNVLINTVGKSPRELLDQFEGKGHSGAGSGDVKYHLGYSADILTPGGPVHVALAFNPSHLEIIGPVVEGSVRARQDRRHNSGETAACDAVLPILVHGDAAFSGQGVVMETFSLSQTYDYTTGGTIHIIVNNQIGFTTSEPKELRSTPYCTDVAKMVEAPIFHVNGDEPEAVVMAARLALDFRAQFRKDVVIDMYCYRRYGHNETDEPFATQPQMYERIRQRPDVVAVYAERLVAQGVLEPGEAERMGKEYVAALEHNDPLSRPQACDLDDRLFRISFDDHRDARWDEPVDTSIPLVTLCRLAERSTALPPNFLLHRSVEKINEARKKMTRGDQAMDWGFGETLAYASLLDAGYPVRLSGQDTERGTFFHRHAVLHDQTTGTIYTPLQNIREGQAPFRVINSILSEEAVLAFEYGFSASEPGGLVIWEAQFGDFANNAQVVIDQFISSSEAKWGRLSGLTMLLPHGYEGQGPEHSSARLERFLQLCAEQNIQVAVPSTPAQIFHLLRRQAMRRYRKPLIVMTPKSLLRHRLATSGLREITAGLFQPVIDEIDSIDPQAVRRLLICSGKVYYDLLEARRKNTLDQIAIVRLEQQYPFPGEQMNAVLARYPLAHKVVWVQEEPRNQGAWVYLLARKHLRGCLRDDQLLILHARPHSASPSVGYLSQHLEQQQRLVEDALLLNVGKARTKAETGAGLTRRMNVVEETSAQG